MKKTLALIVAGSLMFTSMMTVSTTVMATDTTGSSSVTTEELMEQIESLTKALEKSEEANKKTISDLTKQIADLTNAVKASGSTGKPKSSSSSGGDSGSSSSNSTSSYSTAEAYKRSNAVGYGSNTVAQGGHVEINGGKSNVTFQLTPATDGQLASANTLAASVGGTLLNCVTTSSPGASFKSAKVNFYVSGVVNGDNIAVYQLQNNKWVQVSTAEIRTDHVVVNLTKHGTIAFVRVPVLASATN